MAKNKKEPVKQENNFDKVSLIASEINKKYGLDIIKTASETASVRRIVFDSPVMNYVYGGGLPLGRIIEKQGKQHSFKTTESLKVLKMFQDYCFNCHTQDALTTEWGLSKKGTPVIRDCKCKNCKEPRATIQVFIDLERTTDKDFMKTFGIDPRGVLYTIPENSSQAGVFIKTISKLDDIGLIILDSLGALGTKNEIENAIDDKQMNDNARITNMIIRGILSSMNYNGNRAKNGELFTTVYIINKKYQKISGYGGYVEQGGYGLKHAKTISTENRVIEEIYDQDTGETLGKMVAIKNTKHKAGIPNRKGEFYINQNREAENLVYLETDIKQEYFEFGLVLGIIKKGGAWYEYDGFKAQGKKKTLEGIDFELLKEDVDSKLTI